MAPGWLANGCVLTSDWTALSVSCPLTRMGSRTSQRRMKPFASGALAGDAGRRSDRAGARAAAVCAPAAAMEIDAAVAPAIATADTRVVHEAVLVSSMRGSGQGVLNSQRWRSLSGLNRLRVGMLLPAADSARGSIAFGSDFGITRYVPSVS